MKALTVQQPWAWAIVHGGKDIENRTQAWKYRGPLAIHAGRRISRRGLTAAIVKDARARLQPGRGDLMLGAITGVVDLIDVHRDADECCTSPWAEWAYDQHTPDGYVTRVDIVHLVLANPRPLHDPIPARGALGLWTPNDDLLRQIQAQV